jgi:hypothetical protein
VLAIEGRFLLTLSETGDALVLTLSETGLTFAETCSQSGAAGAPWMRLVQIALQDTRPAQMGRPAAMSLAVIS